jgi:DNA-binding IclR family transcriptional regulator
MPKVRQYPAAARATRQEYSAPALEKGIQIFELLAGEQGGLTISEIAYRLRRSISELFRIVMVLERTKWLQKDPESARYTVTYRVLELAHRGTPAQAMSLVAAPLMSELSLQIHQSCHLVVPAGGHGLVIVRQENISHPGGFAMRLGAVLNLIGTCAGHVLLAFSDAESREETLHLVPKPWPLRRREVEKRLERVRRQGFELRPSAVATGVTDVCYPIYARDEKVVAALSVPYMAAPGRSGRVTIEHAQARLEQTAHRISQSLVLIR